MNYLLLLFTGISFLLLPAASFAANPLKITFEKATQAYSEGRYQEAIGFYEKTLELRPNFAPAYNYMGLCYEAMGSSENTVKAKELFLKAVEADSKYALVYDNLLRIAYGEADFDTALKYGLQALEINPDLPSIRLKMAWIYLLGKSDSSTAIKYFKEVIKDVKTPNALFGLGLADFMNNNRVDVLDIVTQLRQIKEDVYAEHLEAMLRSGRYIAPEINGTPLIFPSKKEKLLDSEYFEKSSEDIENMPIQLNVSESKPQLDRRGNPVYQEINITPEDRIRQLQQKNPTKEYSY